MKGDPREDLKILEILRIKKRNKRVYVKRWLNGNLATG